MSKSASTHPPVWYHVYNKSIHKFKIFRTQGDVLRLKHLTQYYQYEDQPMSFSNFIDLAFVRREGFDIAWRDIVRRQNYRKGLKILAYCIMDTHLHWLVEECKTGFTSKFTNDVLNSYSRYFNLRYHRKGPLWQNRTPRAPKSEEQLLECTAYIHLNPTTDYLVDKPGQWPCSSYHEYTGISIDHQGLCEIPALIQSGPSYAAWLDTQIEEFRRKAALNRAGSARPKRQKRMARQTPFPEEPEGRRRIACY